MSWPVFMLESMLFEIRRSSMMFHVLVSAVIGVRSEARTSKSSTLGKVTLGRSVVSNNCAFSVKVLSVKRAKGTVFILAGFFGYTARCLI